MDHGTRWLVATLVFVGALIFAVSGSRSKRAPDPPGHDAADVEAEGERAFSCPAPRAGVWRGGKPTGPEVALTFDDGPSDQTRDILRALRRHHARATFFVVGNQVPGREGTLRRMTQQGNEIGNHSTTHSSLPGRDDIRQTSGLIERATGRPPCLFRPPGGDTSPALLRDVRRLGMTTITWDVDAADWADQDSRRIRERVLASVHPGAIVLLHDGGGDRSGTVRSVSAVVGALHARGYKVVPVSELFPGDGDGARPEQPGG
jgi:peptidoglycan/xylan/chitin deacetylase (PgdA/CDA1 family)